MAVRRTATIDDLESAIPDDLEMVERARRNRMAFDELYDRYVESVYRFCNRRLHDDDHAAEATAQVFERAWTGLDRFRGNDALSFRAWLFQIANRLVIDAYRERPNLPLEHAGELPESNIAYLPGPAAERHERQERLRQALAQLPDEQRHIVEMRLSGLNGVEIAAALGRTHSSIKSSQFRAYTRLRELLSGLEETND